MAGYLQIIIWMGCLYLVLKGLSILQTGLASSRAERGNLIAIGVIAMIAAVFGAYYFADLSSQQSQVMSEIGSSLY